jgi:hypothetical protein
MILKYIMISWNTQHAREKRSAYRDFVGEPEENYDLKKIVISYMGEEATSVV